MKFNFSQIKMWPFAIAFLLGFLGILTMNVYLNRREQDIVNNVAEKWGLREISEVLVAKDDIPTGTTIDSSMFAASTLPRQYLMAGAVSAPEYIIGKTAATKIFKGEQILLSKIGTPEPQVGEVVQAGLSDRLPKGSRAVTVQVDSLSQDLKPGDHVDVIAFIPLPGTASADGKESSQIMTVPIFQNVLVLNSGAQAAGSSSVILALPPQEASLMIFAQEHVKLKLLLRSPYDNEIEPPEVMTPEKFNWLIFGPPPPPAPVPKEIEIYRGKGGESKTSTAPASSSSPAK